MLKAEVQKLLPGVYRIFWKGGGRSVAAVGVTSKGGRWLAPANWVSDGTDKISNWHKVERADLIEYQ